MGTEDKSARNLKAGIAVLGIAAVIIFVVVAASGGNEDPGPTPDLACTLAASGAGLVISGLTEGKSTAAIIASVGGPAAVGLGCRQGIKALVEAPDKPVDLTVESPDGSTGGGTVTGSELVAPPPSNATSTCADWGSLTLWQWCTEGTIGPPR